jgi:hypothetical protein
MKTSRILITGASALLLAIAISSCSTSGDHSAATASEKPATTETTTTKGLPNLLPDSVGTKWEEVSLTDVFNQTGIYPDGAQFSGGIDGDGFACSSNLLGTAKIWNGVTFTIGSASSSNVISCAGQTIPLPSGKFSKLQIFATAVNGSQSSQNFTVIYSDANLNKTFNQNLSDWASPDGNDGESQAVAMPYRIQSDGTRDENTYFIYGYSYDLDNKGTVQGLKLPDNDNVKVFAVTLIP